MKHLLIVVALAALLLGCQTTTTGEPGIRYGMSQQEVIERVSRTDKIISTDGDTVVTEGTFAPTRQRARKTFTFQDGKLAVVNHTVL